MPVIERQYAGKEPDYFSHARVDVFGLIPARVERVLELGCGEGATLARLKAEGRCSWAAGVELFPDAAKRAAERLDVVWTGDLEQMVLPVPDASLDLVLCLDVLEHLVDPWAVVRRLAALLRPGGALVASIPNVRHWRVWWPLLTRGRWTYTDSGLLDRTHLRFFTRSTAVALFEQAGLRVEAVTAHPPAVLSRRWIADRLTLGLARDLLDTQLLIRAIRPH